MLEIGMDFNELQKRYSDMNNPDFWLQKAIQKQRSQNLIAIEGAIDYYKQGLRIVR
jgi:predicted nuclease of restriction endonuclease-like (RecB) superfamily